MKKWIFLFHRILTILILLGVVVEFYLAGLGTFHAESIQLHVVTGEALWGASLVLLVISLISMAGKRIMVVSLALFVLLFLQSMLVQVRQLFVEALHPVNAVLIFSVTVYLLMGSFQQSKISKKVGAP